MKSYETDGNIVLYITIKLKTAYVVFHIFNSSYLRIRSHIDQIKLLSYTCGLIGNFVFLTVGVYFGSMVESFHSS